MTLSIGYGQLSLIHSSMETKSLKSTRAVIDWSKPIATETDRKLAKLKYTRPVDWSKPTAT